MRHRASIAALLAGAIIVPRQPTFAEAPAVEDPIQAIKRKPIYSAPADPSQPSASDISATTPSQPASGITTEPQDKSAPPRGPTPTDRLAAQIKTTRLALHKYAVKTEDAVNRGMDGVLNAEQSFTSTIASLAPPKESNEKVLPGGIYVLVAAMAGSIISRNRGIFLRFLTPTVTGVVAANYLVPQTTRNVGNLIWTYEEKYPFVRDNHLRITQGAKYYWETGKAHSQMTLGIVEDKVSGVRESVEDWVKKGK